MAIEVESLAKRLGSVSALRGLDLAVATGQVTGFLGPNDSGKTATIRVLFGFLQADGGGAPLLGGEPWARTAFLHRRIAYVPRHVTLWPNLTCGEAIDLLVRPSGPLDPKRNAPILDLFELDPGKEARGHSKGNRQEVARVVALASDAELLLLDARLG